jgi:PIN domain nuclease of toxin-antitoxin system
VKLLLDTHALLWWWTDDQRLSPNARAAILDPGHTILVSAASAWEIATKHRLGKLSLADEIVPRMDELVRADGFRTAAYPAHPRTARWQLPTTPSRPFRSHAGRAKRDRSRHLAHRRPRFRAVWHANALVAPEDAALVTVGRAWRS